jgi:hypothetical protein
MNILRNFIQFGGHAARTPCAEHTLTSMGTDLPFIHSTIRIANPTNPLFLLSFGISSLGTAHHHRADISCLGPVTALIYAALGPHPLDNLRRSESGSGIDRERGLNDPVIKCLLFHSHDQRWVTAAAIVGGYRPVNNE